MNEATYAAVGLAAVTMLHNVSSSLLAFWEKRTATRDKTASDTKLIQLEQRQLLCEEREKRCDEDKVEFKKQIGELHALILGKRDK